MSEVALKGVVKRYGAVQVVHGIDLAIGSGEFVVLVGPSGCGKSTTLRMIAGLEEISSGEIRIGGRVVNRVAPKDRDVAMVFQNYALYPHLNVADNIAFGLRLRGARRADVDSAVAEAARILGLTEYLGRRPADLSGGQRQRVAMGRAIVREPRVFLFDEPLSNLEARPVDIAERMGVRQPTVAKNLARLQRDGLIRRVRYRSVFLTESGRTLAETCHERHRIVVAFLISLGLDRETAEQDAEGIEHHVSERTLAAYRRALEETHAKGSSDRA